MTPSDPGGGSHCFGWFLVRRNCCSQSSLSPAACRVPRGPARAWLVPDSAKSLRREFYEVTARWGFGYWENPAPETINSRNERQTRRRTGGMLGCAVPAELSRMLAPPLRSSDLGTEWQIGVAVGDLVCTLNPDEMELSRWRRNGRSQSHGRAGRRDGNSRSRARRRKL